MKKYFSLLLTCVVLSGPVSVFAQRKKKGAGNEIPKDTLVLLTTAYGEIKLKLYKETPLHRSNFIKIAQNGVLDSTLFHRVIQGFMIQGGDPDSKHAQPNVMLGNGEVGYTIPAEFVPSLYHKKGALAAARQGDDVNPAKASSGCQFYIVHGKTFNDNDLNNVEQRVNQQVKQTAFSKIIMRPENAGLLKSFVSNQQSNNQDSLKILGGIVDQLIMKEPGLTLFKYSEQARKDYATIGGAPHLDGNYTVFGEVVEGLDVIDKIAALPRDRADRPLEDVRMRVKIILE
jgi:peptidylprolyl isomerase